MQDFSKERARRFRNKAEELRTAAGDVNDRQCRSMLLQIARDYDNIAEAAETRAHAPSSVCRIHQGAIGDPAEADLSVSRSRREAS